MKEPVETYTTLRDATPHDLLYIDNLRKKRALHLALFQSQLMSQWRIDIELEVGIAGNMRDSW